MAAYSIRDLIIPKIETYGLCKSSLSLLPEYLNSHKQRVKIPLLYSMRMKLREVSLKGLF